MNCTYRCIKRQFKIKYAFSYCEAIFHTRSVFHSEAISHAARRISLKKAPTKSMLFSGRVEWFRCNSLDCFILMICDIS